MARPWLTLHLAVRRRLITPVGRLVTAALLVYLLPVLTGCGYRRVPLTPSTLDFALTVTPQASTVAAGSAVPTETLTVMPVNGFAGRVTVIPNVATGITCTSTPCQVTVGPASSAALQFTTAPTIAAGVDTITFTGVSGTLTHSVTATVTITAATTTTPPPPTPPLPPPTTPPVPPVIAQACAVPAATSTPAYKASGFIPLANPSSTTGATYDPMHNQLFVSNIQLNSIDILSPESMAVVARLSIPQPMSLDLSADGSHLIIGTRTHYFYQVATSTLCVTDREYLPILPPLNFDLSPMHPAALADGSILFASFDVNSSASSLYRWIPGTGFLQPPGLGYLAGSVGDLVISGDRTHAYLSAQDSSDDFGRFDLSTGAVTVFQPAFGSQPSVIAVNADGSRALIGGDCCALGLVDSNFNKIASQTGLSLDSTVINRGVTAAPDFSHFYAKDIQQSYATILDASLQPTGILPFSLPDDFGDYGFVGMDGAHRLILTLPSGLLLLNTSAESPQPTTGTSPSVGTGAMIPNTPESGYATTLNGAGFLPNPAISFLGVPVTTPVPGAITFSSNVIDMTAPAFSAGCFDVLAAFPNSYTVIAPLAYCYSPQVDTVDGDAGPASGGGTLTLYGRGFGSQPSVTIGGVEATNVTATDIYKFTTPYGQSQITATAPAGHQGSADIVISSTTGSLLLKGAYTYAERQDTALPAGAQPIQLILDAPRGRALLTDAAHNQVLVYALSTGAVLQQIATGPRPQALALTPDGTKLLLTTVGDNKVAVLDAGTYVILAQATLPSTAQPFGSVPVGPAIGVLALAGNQAIIKTEAGYLSSFTTFTPPFVFDYDLATNTLQSDPHSAILPTASDYSVAASGDGNSALLGNELINAATGAYAAPDLATGSVGDVALNADGSVNTLDAIVFDSSMHWQTILTAPAPIPIPPFEEAFYPGAQMNPSGSLLYRATADHVRLYDTAHGILARTLEIPGGAVGSSTPSSTQRLLAVDPQGQRIALVTNAGFSIFTFASDPLSLKRVQLSGAQFTVAGSGFQPGASLRFDQVPAACTVDNSSTLTGTLPSLSAGVHAATVSNPDGSTYTLTLAFTTQ